MASYTTQGRTLRERRCNLREVPVIAGQRGGLGDEEWTVQVLHIQRLSFRRGIDLLPVVHEHLRQQWVDHGATHGPDRSHSVRQVAAGRRTVLASGSEP